MKWENRKKLRDALVGREIKDVVFHDSHGLIIDIVLENGENISVSTYDDPEKNIGDFYVGLNQQEL